MGVELRGEREVGSQWGYSQWEVWGKDHLVCCHPGNLRHLFLQEEEKSGCWLVSSELGQGLAGVSGGPPVG